METGPVLVRPDEAEVLAIGVIIWNESAAAAAYTQAMRRVWRWGAGVLAGLALLPLTPLHPLWFFTGAWLAFISLFRLGRAWFDFRPLRRQQQRELARWQGWVNRTVAGKSYHLQFDAQALVMGEAGGQPVVMPWNQCDIIIIRPDFVHLQNSAENQSVLLPRRCLEAGVWLELVAIARQWANALPYPCEYTLAPEYE